MQSNKLRKPKIGLVLSSPPQYSETFFLTKIEGLIDEGYDVIVFSNYAASDKSSASQRYKLKSSPETYRNPIRQGITLIAKVIETFIENPRNVKRYVKIGRKQGYNLSRILKGIYMDSHILASDVDYLHFGFATNALQRETLAKAIGAKMSVSLRGFDIGIYPVKNPGCYNRLWQEIDRLHYISDDLLELAKKNGFADQVSAFKVTPAIDTSDIPFKEDDFFEGSSLKVLTVGRLNWKKGYPVALSALAKLKHKGIPFKYDIVGEGQAFEELKYLVHILDLKGEVNFLGKKSHEQVKADYKNYDLYLQPSIQEGFCNSVLEAQAAGLLCIVSDAEGLSENVLNKQTGWVVPKRNENALAEMILEVSSMSQEKLKSIAKKARQRVIEEFNLTKQKALFAEFFRF
jgi:colanic acid/amylovoran biosynthesis glycosyltransferase